MRDRKGKYIGIIGALLVHAAIIALLLIIGLTIPEKEEESGVEVVIGDVEESYGGFDPSSLVDVDIDTDSEPYLGSEPDLPSEQELITQVKEETVVVEEKKGKEEKKPEKTAAEKAAEARRLAEQKAEKERKAAADARKLAEEKAARERKAAEDRRIAEEKERKAKEEAANKLVAGAFGKGSQMGSGQTTGQTTQGSPTGTSSGSRTQGSSGYGTFDLGGRSIGEGGLPRPIYNVQEEGKVVVSITVNPGGYVVATSIHRATNTVNLQLRRAAVDAAKKARFNVVEGVNNQMGTITYFFNLK